MKKELFISLISACVLLTIGCHSKKKATNPGTKEPDFAIKVTPQSQGVMAGESAEFKITLTSLNGFSDSCTLSVGGFPQGDSAVFDSVVFDSSVLVPTDSSRLAIYTTFSTPRQTYDFVITGKNGKVIHSDTVTLAIPSEKVTDYYPLAIGNSWTYAWLDQNGRTWMTTSLTIIDTDTINSNFGYLFSGLEFIYVKGDTIFSLSLKTMNREIVLLGPLVIGQSWTTKSWNYELIEFGAVTLIKGDEYKNCIKFKKTHPDRPGSEQYEWWAKDVGYVKMEEYISGQYQGSRELESFILH